MRVEIDGVVGLGALEDAAVEFARRAPAELVAATVEAQLGVLLDEVCGPFGDPISDEDQITAPWACGGCGSMRGFRRRGSQPRGRTVTSRVGPIRFGAAMVACRSCGKRFSPLNQLLELRPYQRRTDGLQAAAAGLAVEVAYAKASRMLAELVGVEVSARSIRRDVVGLGPDRLGPGEDPASLCVPVLMLDGTGERAGTAKGGVGFHLAIGLVARQRRGRRTICQVEVLAATLDEPWEVVFDLLEGISPGLIVVDGEDDLSRLADERFAGVPRQRCLWHLSAAVTKALRYSDRAPASTVDEHTANLEQILTDAWQHRDPGHARECLDLLADILDIEGCPTAAGHLRRARSEVFTYITNPHAGRLVTGHKGRPDVGTGVIERIMRELNRRTDNGVRWTVEGCRKLLMLKLQHRYHQGPWTPSTPTQPPVKITLQPPHQRAA